MAVFRIADKQLMIQVNVFEVTADTKEEALELYNSELAGSLVSVDDYTLEASAGEGNVVES
jgi:hypothetical protein